MLIFLRQLETEDKIFFENNNLNMNHNKAEIINIPKKTFYTFGRVKNID